ncbi:hypothetical protein MHSWG343_08490 [Candidatus Mycoplasma haematohominis]|uniref:Uncharacterized protein n=1 Tax=Candidatus Mycoplasma haematohominis TaxID=1494318 RepID=A0A478FR09_9MOLU|nr:hypothetical protein MHSWG343_08490 [Candidatus Mycoplasma haemohominis]
MSTGRLIWSRPMKIVFTTAAASSSTGTLLNSSSSSKQPQMISELSDLIEKLETLFHEFQEKVNSYTTPEKQKAGQLKVQKVRSYINKIKEIQHYIVEENPKRNTKQQLKKEIKEFCLKIYKVIYLDNTTSKIVR